MTQLAQSIQSEPLKPKPSFVESDEELEYGSDVSQAPMTNASAPRTKEKETTQLTPSELVY
jgi:hypothetical protein